MRSGYSPECSLKSISGPRLTSGNEGLYHISMDSYLKRLDTREYKQSMESGDQYNDTLRKWTAQLQCRRNSQQRYSQSD